MIGDLRDVSFAARPMSILHEEIRPMYLRIRPTWQQPEIRATNFIVFRKERERAIYMACGFSSLHCLILFYVYGRPLVLRDSTITAILNTSLCSYIYILYNK